MSQHRFPAQTSTGRAVEVLIGYDRPLNGFFLVVTAAELETAAMADLIDAGEPDDDEGDFDGDAFVYSNLDDIDLIDLGGHTLDLEYFKAKLAWLGIVLPSSIEGELHQDRLHRVSNRVCHYDAAGVPQPDAEG